MDIWEEMYLKAKEEYHPEDISPFLTAHHVVAALQSAKTGKIYVGFCGGRNLVRGLTGVASHFNGWNKMWCEGGRQQTISLRSPTDEAIGQSHIASNKVFYGHLTILAIVLIPVP